MTESDELQIVVVPNFQWMLRSGNHFIRPWMYRGKGPWMLIDGPWFYLLEEGSGRPGWPTQRRPHLRVSEIGLGRGYFDRERDHDAIEFKTIDWYHERWFPGTTIDTLRAVNIMARSGIGPPRLWRLAEAWRWHLADRKKHGWQLHGGRLPNWEETQAMNRLVQERGKPCQNAG